MMFSAIVYDKKSNSSSRREISADDIESARRNLENVGLSVMEIELMHSSQPTSSVFSARKMSTSDQLYFFHNFSVSLRGGLGSARGLRSFSENCPPQYSAKFIQASREVESGEPLYHALKKTGFFDDFTIGVIKAGSAASDLPSALKQLHERLKLNKTFTFALRKSLAMPVASMVISLCVILASQLILIPQVKKNFLSSKFVPSALTKADFMVNDVFRLIWIPAAFVLIGFTLALIFSEGFRSTVLYVIMSRWKLLRKSIMAFRQWSFLSTLHILTTNGIGLQEGIYTASESMKGTPMMKELHAAAEALRIGTPLWQCFNIHTSLDKQIIQMIQIVDEAGGKLTDQLQNMSDIYKEDCSYFLDSLALRINFLSYGVATFFILFGISMAMIPMFEMMIQAMGKI